MRDWKMSKIYKHANNIFEAEERRRRFVLDILYKIMEILCYWRKYGETTSRCFNNYLKFQVMHTKKMYGLWSHNKLKH